MSPNKPRDQCKPRYVIMNHVMSRQSALEVI